MNRRGVQLSILYSQVFLRLVFNNWWVRTPCSEVRSWRGCSCARCDPTLLATTIAFAANWSVEASWKDGPKRLYLYLSLAGSQFRSVDLVWSGRAPQGFRGEVRLRLRLRQFSKDFEVSSIWSIAAELFSIWSLPSLPFVFYYCVLLPPHLFFALFSPAMSS